jgi:LPXTG-site transpeptidase (sortase) family protein
MPRLIAPRAAARPRRLATAVLALVAGIGSAAAAIVTPVGPATGAFAGVGTSRFVPLPSPQRLVDTRAGIGSVPAGRPAGEATLIAPVANQVGVPANALAVVMNVTMAAAAGPGFITVYPSGQARPNASSVNAARTGRVVPNLVTVPLGPDGQVAIYASTATDVIADVFGYYVPASSATAGRFVSVGPVRAYDSRTGGAPPLAPDSTIHVSLQPHVPVGATAAVLNVTAAGATGPGFLTVFADGAARPNTSNLNVDTPGQTVPNQVIVPVSASGVSIYTSGGGHVIVDVAGWFTGASAPSSTDGLFVPVTPTRLLDTRVAGALNPLGSTFRPAPGTTVEVPVSGRAGVGVAAAVVMNVTVTSSHAAGFVTAYPAGQPQPNASNLNVSGPGETVANHVVSPVGARGVALFTQNGAHLVLDVTGWYTGVGEASPLPVPAVPPVLGASMPGHLEVPAAGIDETVREGVDLGTLSAGPGHYPDTGLPGPTGNTAIFGHRVSHSHPFRWLNVLNPGDDLYITADGTRFHYKVDHTDIVGANEFTILDPTPVPTVTLVACHPPGTTIYRIVVRAVLVDHVDL